MPTLRVKGTPDILTPRVAIVGGGITGLSAAWRLQQSGIPYTLLESSSRWGGKIQSETVEGFGDAPFILEVGPDAFLSRKPAALDLIRELGLESRVVSTNRANARTFVLHHGKPVPLPEGLPLLVPTKLLPFLRSPLLSPFGKLRVLMDWFIPARTSDADETLATFVRRRLGNEVLSIIAEPMLAGIFNAEPERMSLLATFPQFRSMERERGSLLCAVRRQQSRQPESTPALPAFISLKGGAQTLVDALVERLDGDLRLNAGVQGIARQPGDGYKLELDDGTDLEADTLILTAPASVCAELLNDPAPDAASLLRQIRFTGVGSVALAYRRDDIPHPLNGFGVVIPSRENRQIDGMTWVSSKWQGRAPDGYALLRVFFGGPYSRETMRLDDEGLLAVVQRELASSLDVHAPPLFHRIHRWRDAYPQYDLGHLERLAAIEATLPPGVFLAGNSYRGVGVPDCIRQGNDAARAATALLAHPQESYA